MRIAIIGAVIAGVFTVIAAYISSINVNVKVNLPDDSSGNNQVSNQTAIPKFATSKPYENLVLLADFEDRSANRNIRIDVMQRVFDQISSSKTTWGLSNIRVEFLSNYYIQNTTTAKDLLTNSNAKILIWGWKDDGGAFINILRGNDSTSSLSNREVVFPNSSLIPICLSQDLPAQASYLAAYSLASSDSNNSSGSNNKVPIQILEDALRKVNTYKFHDECSAFDVSDGYSLLGYLYLLDAGLFRPKALADDTTNNYTNAINSLKRAVSLNPQNFLSYFNLSLAEASLADLKNKLGDQNEFVRLKRDAISSSKIAINLEPKVDYSKGMSVELVKAANIVNMVSDEMDLAFSLSTSQSNESIALCNTVISETTTALDNGRYFIDTLLYARSQASGLYADLVQPNHTEASNLRRNAIEDLDHLLKDYPQSGPLHLSIGYHQLKLAESMLGRDPIAGKKLLVLSIMHFDAAISSKSDPSLNFIKSVNTTDLVRMSKNNKLYAQSLLAKLP
jgi:tetratricopeptide (TPR) repeat protein